MNSILSLFQLITIITICVYEYKKKYVSVFLWGTLLVMFGFPHFLSVIFKTTLYDEGIMIKASVFVILFNLIYLSTKIFTGLITEGLSKKDKKSIVVNESDEFKKQHTMVQDKNMVNLFFIVLVCSLVILLMFGIRYLGSIVNFSWANFYNANRKLGLRSSLKRANILFFASSGVALVYKRLGKKPMFLISLGIIIFYAMATGNRITILPALMALMIPYILDKNKKLSFKQIIVLLVMGLFSVYVVYFLRLLRIYGGFYKFINQIDFAEVNSIIWEMMLNGDGELGLRNAFYHFIYYDNNFNNFNKGHTYIRLLLIAIPTSLIPGIKPPDFAISMGSAWSGRPYNTTYSMHPTLYGDCFANLWWFGIFLGIYWALLTFLLEKHINRENNIVRDLLRVLFGSVYVIVGRGSVYNGLFLGFTGSIIIAIIYLLSNFLCGFSLGR